MQALNPLQGVFITGTGTGIGKSIVTAALNHVLWSLHHKDFQGYLAVKPIQTGTVAHDAAQANQYIGDCAIYAEALKHMPLETPSAFTPKTLHHFAMPASPHLASEQECINLSISDLYREILHLSMNIEHCPMLIEGAGGVYVPLNDQETMLDLMQSLGLPIILVMQNTLGAINHTLLSIDALQTHNLTIAAIICTETDENDLLIKADNIKTIAKHAPKIPIYSLPYMAEFSHPEINPKVWAKGTKALALLAAQLVNIWKTNTEKRSHISSSSTILDFDKAHLWHPYTSSINPLPVYEVTHTQGMHIFLQNKAEPLIDGMSSWWCAAHGYGNAKLIQAAKDQIDKMPHVMFGGLTHEPAIKAAQTLLQLLLNNTASQKKLKRIFWSDSGSVAVEVAMKMAMQYQHGRAQKQRTLFLSPRGGYYGDTLGAMSVCDPVNGMHTLFNHVLAQHIFIPRPECAFDGTMNTAFDETCLEPLENAFKQYGNKLAAFIIEPIVQGAGGMWFYDPRYLQRVEELCNAHDVLLIFDEIATGFGRTGKMFAANWTNITPDICCVGKALTGGFMSLAATICTEEVAENICANEQVFMHGPTFMANALACAVAQASLNIFANHTWKEQVASIEKELKQGLAPCKSLEGVAHVRVLGAIGVVEMHENVNVAALQDFFVQNNVWIRPFAKLIYIMPPYIASHADIKKLTQSITLAIKLKVHKL